MQKFWFASRAERCNVKTASANPTSLIARPGISRSAVSVSRLIYGRGVPLRFVGCSAANRAFSSSKVRESIPASRSMKTEQINEGKEEEAWMAYRDAAQRHGLRAGVAAASLQI